MSERMELIPPSLTFELGTENPVCVIKVKNTSDEPRAFAIRTTNLLDVFRFKPSKGLVPKGESVNVTALLSEEKRQVLVRRKEFRCRDEFLIVSMPTTEGFLADYNAVDESDVAQRRAMLDHLFKQDTKSKRTKLLFNAFYIPPVQKHMSNLQERFISSFLARTCFKKAAQLSDGSVRLSATDISLNILAKKNPAAPLTIYNRCEYYVMYAVTTSGSSDRFAIEPHAKGIISPRESATLMVSLKLGMDALSQRDNVAQVAGGGIRTFVSALDASNESADVDGATAQQGDSQRSNENLEAFSVMCTTVTDPDFIDLAITVADVKEEHDKVFDEFWENFSETPSHNVWRGSFNCHLVQEKAQRGPKLGRRFSSHSVMARSKSTILQKAMLTEKTTQEEADNTEIPVTADDRENEPTAKAEAGTSAPERPIDEALASALANT